MEREKKLIVGFLTIICIFLAVVLFLLNTLGDAKESCESYYEQKIIEECFDNNTMEVVDYDFENYLSNTKRPSS